MNHVKAGDILHMEGYPLDWYIATGVYKVTLNPFTNHEDVSFQVFRLIGPTTKEYRTAFKVYVYDNDDLHRQNSLDSKYKPLDPEQILEGANAIMVWRRSDLEWFLHCRYGRYDYASEITGPGIPLTELKEQANEEPSSSSDATSS